jgi:hypothetical protein
MCLKCPAGYNISSLLWEIEVHRKYDLLEILCLINTSALHPMSLQVGICAEAEGSIVIALIFLSKEILGMEGN